MLGAYRDGLAAPPTALREVLWRRRVGTAATWLFGLLVADFAIPAVSDAAHWHAWGAALRVACKVAIAFAVWMLTAPRPGARASRLGWLLRAAATGLPLAELAYFFTHYWTPFAVSEFVVEVAVMAYVAHLFDDGEDPVSARTARLLAVPFAAGPYIVLWLHRPFPTIAAWATLAAVVCMVWAGILLLRLRDMLNVTDGQWWFDNGMEVRGAWVSLLRYVDGYAEVVGADGRHMRFTSRADGEKWLEQHGYVPAKRAIEEHLTTAMPPDILPAARSRKWLRLGTTKGRSRKRVHASTPSEDLRMRVAPGASGREPHKAAEGTVEEEELDEYNAVDTVDEAASPRAAEVEEPRNDRD